MQCREEGDFNRPTTPSRRGAATAGVPHLALATNNSKAEITNNVLETCSKRRARLEALVSRIAPPDQKTVGLQALQVIRI
jgi:hypothetical protein